MNANNLTGRFVYFLMGILACFGILFLTGAGNGSQVGRYQVSTCLKRDWVYVYVIDTATGAVKFVDEKDENKPFEEIKKK
jgi:hypothetical protein